MNTEASIVDIIFKDISFTQKEINFIAAKFLKVFFFNLIHLEKNIHYSLL